MTPAIFIENVNFAYNNGQSVLQNINLNIAQGEFLGIVGPNGGGKTTLLKLISGLLKPNTGKITVLGKHPKKARQMLGYVPQFTKLDRDFPISVEQVVLTGRLGKTRNIGGYTQKDQHIAHEMLQQLEVGHLAKKSINALSGGQLQRVMIARALVSEPKLLLLDEPTANIDIHAEKNIFSFLKDINQEVTILVVSHDIGFISHYIKRVACINQTLICHQTSSLNSKDIHELYDLHVNIIQHAE